MLTVSEWAKRLGVSRQAAHKAVERCGIPLTDGKLDPDVADVLYQKRTRVRARQRPPEGAMAAGAPSISGAQAPAAVGDAGGEDYWQSRARRERAEAETAELRLAELLGDLVRVADVKAAHSKRLAALRESLLQLPARLSAVMAAESSQQRCFDVLQQEVHGVLQLAAEG